MSHKWVMVIGVFRMNSVVNKYRNSLNKKVLTKFVENVPENAEAERVIRDIAAQGSNIILGTTFDYMEPCSK